MEDNFGFLLHSARLIQLGRYDEDDIHFVNDLVLSIDNDLLIFYNNHCTIPKLGNDLKIYVKIVRFLIKYYEETEQYEKCIQLTDKLNQTTQIIENQNQIL